MSSRKVPTIIERHMTASMYASIPSASGSTTSPAASATRSETSANGPIDMCRDEPDMAYTGSGASAAYSP